MSLFSWRTLAGLTVPLCAWACSDDEGSTDLNPTGPPMIRQVMLIERYTNTAGEQLIRPVIAFGSHPDADGNEQHAVTNAVVFNQRVRVVIDELLVGNNLEEIECNGPVDEDSFSRVPLGATPDDIARCAVAPDLLAKSCKGDKAVCIRASDGVPVGVRDEVDGANRPYKDGIADTTRMIEGSVGLLCQAGGNPIHVPIQPGLSYWQPSGNQQRPIVDDGLRGLFSLGPAIVLVSRGDLPTSADCTVEVAPYVVDKSGLSVCAPPGGDVTADCRPGDTSAVAFSTEPMRLIAQVPAQEAIGVSRTADLQLRANAAFANDLTVSSVPPASFTATADPDLPQQLNLHPVTALAAGTRYVVTVPLRDAYHLGPSEPVRLVFTTGN
jgi:hypothetical protein